MIRHFIFLVLFLLFSIPAFAKVSATVDRVTIEQGETFLLTIQSDDSTPELDVLEPFFNILGTSRSSKVSFINGAMSSLKEWLITLSPKNTGVSVIPSITVGKEKTQPIRIEVVKAKVLNAAQGADIFLEVSLDSNSPYVQSQVIYIARLFRAVEIREGSLTEPEINTAVVERMGEDVTFQTTRNQRRYHVTERQFALFPQKSGSMVIPPTVFDGQVLATQSSGQQANDPFNRFFQQQQRTRRVQIKSDALTLDVLPQPTTFTGENWLPAKRVVLGESWSVEPPQFKVGEPITRTIKIQAVGQTGAQLPEFKDLPSDGIKQYVDQPKVETGVSDGSLVGIREEKFAIIPTTSGKLVLPELRLSWWDTVLDKEQLVTIPSRVIDVAPASASVAGNQPTQIMNNSDSIQNGTQDNSIVNVQPVGDSGFWQIMALALGFGWLITVIAWLYQMKKTKVKYDAEQGTSNDSESLNEARKRLDTACKNNNASEAKSALLAWGGAAWPENKTRSLLSVGERLQDPNVIQAVIELDEVLYSHVDSAWNGEVFWSVVGQKLKKPRNYKEGKIRSLPSLYPQ